MQIRPRWHRGGHALEMRKYSICLLCAACSGQRVGQRSNVPASVGISGGFLELCDSLIVQALPRIDCSSAMACRNGVWVRSKDPLKLLHCLVVSPHVVVNQPDPEGDGSRALSASLRAS